MILGEWIPQLNSDYLPERKFQQASVWMTLTLDGYNRNQKLRRPKLHSFYSCGYLYRTSCYLIEYKAIRTDKLQYVETGLQHGLSSSFAQSISQINAAHDLFVFLNKALPSSSLRNHYSINITVWWYLAHIPLLLAWIWHLIAVTLVTICSVPIPICFPGNFSYVRLRDVSMFFEYVTENCSCHLRSNQWCALFSASWSRPPKYRQVLWHRLSGFVVFVLLDVSSGCLLGACLFKYSDVIIEVFITTAYFLERKLLMEQLEWFKHAPGGIQLNPLLTRHFVESCITFFELSHHYLGILQTFANPILKIISCLGAFGLSTQLALVVDIFRVISLHISFVYVITSFLHRIQVSMLVSLWYLFYGKKINILRGRVDTYNCDKQQLLLGTALFAVLAFLFPTFTAFYILFFILRFLLLGCELFLWSVIVLMRHCPIYKVWLSFAFPTSQTNGVKFAVESNATGSDTISVLSKISASKKSFGGSTIESFPNANGILYTRPIRLQALTFLKGDHRRKWGRGILSSSSSPALINGDESDGFIRTPDIVDSSDDEVPSLTADYERENESFNGWSLGDASGRETMQGIRSASGLPKSSLIGVNIYLKLICKTRSITQILNMHRFVDRSMLESVIRNMSMVLGGTEILRLKVFRSSFPRLEVGSADKEDVISEREIGVSVKEAEFWNNVSLGFGKLAARHVPLFLLKQQSSSRYILIVLSFSQVYCLFAVTLGCLLLASEFTPLSTIGNTEISYKAPIASNPSDSSVPARFLAVIGGIIS